MQTLLVMHKTPKASKTCNFVAWRVFVHCTVHSGRDKKEKDKHAAHRKKIKDLFRPVDGGKTYDWVTETKRRMSSHLYCTGPPWILYMQMHPFLDSCIRVTCFRSAKHINGIQKRREGDIQAGIAK